MTRMYSTKLTSRNQTTIPEEIRKFLGIKPGEKVEWIIEGEKVILRANASIQKGKMNIRI